MWFQTLLKTQPSGRKILKTFKPERRNLERRKQALTSLKILKYEKWKVWSCEYCKQHTHLLDINEHLYTITACIFNEIHKVATLFLNSIIENNGANSLKRQQTLFPTWVYFKGMHFYLTSHQGSKSMVELTRGIHCYNF